MLASLVSLATLCAAWAPGSMPEAPPFSGNANSDPPFPINVTELECGFRRWIFEKASATIPWRSHRFTFDSLELQTLCNMDMPPTTDTNTRAVNPSREKMRRHVQQQLSCSMSWIVFVSPDGDDQHDGSVTSPFRTIERAVRASREHRRRQLKKEEEEEAKEVGRTIVLRQGTYYLNDTLRFSSEDSDLTIQSHPDEQAWISGGVGVPEDVTWNPSPEHEPSSGVFVADLSGTLAAEIMKKHHGTWGYPSLFGVSPHTRWIRARYPNGNPETAQWGYASVSRDVFALPGEAVQEWIRPQKGGVPSFRFVDLSVSSNPSGVVKNDSTMDNYNTYGVGYGGVCSDVWNMDEGSYWCGNNSDGGWAEVDRACAEEGHLQIPNAMIFDAQYQHLNSTLGKRWSNASLEGGVVHAWHSQSWAVHMFRVSSFDRSKHQMEFTKGSGGQGGRNWCRCDQCGYAASWCRDNDTRLIGGGWYIENVISEVDSGLEWYLDPDLMRLYVKPNHTDIPRLVFGNLETLIHIGQGARNISLMGLGFRDTSATYMKEKAWGVPSGGDWALYRGGAVVIENATDVTIEDGIFSRLDGNGVFLSRMTRGVSISNNVFEWLGENAVATWGETDGYDARSGSQSRGSVFELNYVHDIGIYEKQSSAWGQAKACMSTLASNVLFNLPRAAINLNDQLGGGNHIHDNVIWNACRESGDHGPINTWDRMPFLTNLRTSSDGSDTTSTFTPLPTTIANNLIMANYGASQGVDNDDGSSWFLIENNVFYAADGFKMDYGGHDSTFRSNLIVVVPYDGQNCYDVEDFQPNHAHRFFNNTCVSGVSPNRVNSGCSSPLTCPRGEIKDTRLVAAVDMDLVGSAAACNQDVGGSFLSSSNRFFSLHGNASITCEGRTLDISAAQKAYGIESGSTFGKLPDADQILAWAKELLR